MHYWYALLFGDEHLSDTVMYSGVGALLPSDHNNNSNDKLVFKESVTVTANFLS